MNWIEVVGCVCVFFWPYLTIKTVENKPHTNEKIGKETEIDNDNYLLEQCIHEFWACSFLFFTSSLCPSLYLLKLCVYVKKIVAIGWGECSLGATSYFIAHSKRKKKKKCKFFMQCSECLCIIFVSSSSFHCNSHTLHTHRLQYFLFIFLFFRQLLLCFSFFLLILSRFSRHFFFFRFAIFLLLQLFRTIHLISLKSCVCFFCFLALIRKFRASNSVLLFR